MRATAGRDSGKPRGELRERSAQRERRGMLDDVEEDQREMWEVKATDAV